MTPRLAEELLAMLEQQPLALEELHERARLAGSPWSVEQVELFLISLAGIERDASGRFLVGNRSPGDELRTAILEAARSFGGKPVPAAQVRARIPNHFVTTDEQIRAIARQIPELELVGPGLIRTKKGELK